MGNPQGSFPRPPCTIGRELSLIMSMHGLHKEADRKLLKGARNVLANEGQNTGSFCHGDGLCDFDVNQKRQLGVMLRKVEPLMYARRKK